VSHALQRGREALELGSALELGRSVAAARARRGDRLLDVMPQSSAFTIVSAT